MSALGPSGSSSHAGLSFPQPGIRRTPGFPPLQHANPANKPSPASHNASPYQPQAYTPQQPPQGTYPHHLFQTNNSVNGNVNGNSRSSQSHVPNAVVGRQRGPPPRQQMQSQPNPPSMLYPQTLNQPVQNEPNILSHQPRSQPPPQLPQPQAQPPVQQQVQQVQQVQQQQQQQVQQVQPPPQNRPQTPAQVQERHGHGHSRGPDDMEVEGHPDGDDDGMEPKLIDGTPFVPRQPMGDLMTAPPEGGSYPTLEAVHKSVLSYCTSVGYAIVIGRSKKTVPGLKKVLFVCDRAGKPPSRVSPEFRKRKTSSRKCDCPFGFFAIEQRTQWTIRYRPDPHHLQHNHGPSESPLLHPAARKLDSKMVAAVKALKENGVGVSETLEILQTENPHVPLLPRDIYNARAAINRNPQKVATGLAENRPAIYSKPHPTAEERIRADLRRELAKTREDFDKYKDDKEKEIDELKKKLQEKDQIIEKFEMFIDICNQRVMVQRERLSGPEGGPATGGPGN